jgi:hypothetical protein
MTKKPRGWSILWMCLLLNAVAPAAGPSQPKPGGPSRPSTASELRRLYDEERLFELRDAVTAGTGEADPDLEFFRGAVDAAFNRMDSAVRRLRSYLDSGANSGTARAMAREAWILLADAYRRTGRYRDSAEAQRRILALFAADLDSREKANRQNQALLWSALADVPPMTVDVPEDVSIRLDNRLFPVTIQERAIESAYDTGSSLSVLYASAARELALPLLGEGAKVQSGTGQWIDSRLTVVPELRLGRAVIRNAVFLVLPDEDFPVRTTADGRRRRGLIGAPVLNALREISETSDGRLFIPAAPQPRGDANMFFYGYQPVVEAKAGGERVRLVVDNGSAVTYLYPPYFRRHQKDLEAGSMAREIRMGGAGGERALRVHVMERLPLLVGGRDLVLHKVMVHAEVTNSVTEIFDGTLGRDILAPGMKATISFESMRFLLEEDSR